MQPQTTSPSISVWLLLCLAVITAIIVVNGTTKLRESGLSIAEWHAINLFNPPSTEDEFKQEFEKYKAMPQFQKAFPNMEVGEFRIIYRLEYMRYVFEYMMIFMFIVPMGAFYAMRILNWKQVLQFVAIFMFGSLRYGLNDFLTANGLTDDSFVMPYRMSLQMFLQFMFFALVLWKLLSFSYPKPGIGGLDLPSPPRLLKVFACVTLGFIFLQVVLGGAVSGLHAGLMYNTFPLMDSQWVPEGLWSNAVWYKNLFEDATTAQFVHRVLSYELLVIVVGFWIAGHNNPHIAHLLPILFSIFVVQFLLGVLTLLFTVPVPIASLHQANAVLLFGIAVTITHRLFLPIKTIYYDIGTSAI